ncbi:MAG: D-alanyl-D-alanine carboxypeptidase family protein, partial [Oscillospiraceae bacterium]|nr:D-alanyl-D-alanine carboxypeptidase family protein [Oscillospiraceae bacterium]
MSWQFRTKKQKNVAMPGRSEHNTGLAVDFYSHSNESANLEQIFATTPEG